MGTDQPVQNRTRFNLFVRSAQFHFSASPVRTLICASAKWTRGASDVWWVSVQYVGHRRRRRRCRRRLRKGGGRKQAVQSPNPNCYCTVDCRQNGDKLIGFAAIFRCVMLTESAFDKGVRQSLRCVRARISIRAISGRLLHELVNELIALIIIYSHQCTSHRRRGKHRRMIENTAVCLNGTLSEMPVTVGVMLHFHPFTNIRFTVF